MVGARPTRPYPRNRMEGKVENNQIIAHEITLPQASVPPSED